MISQPERARPRRRRTSESYDEKCERRHETRENLRRRNNLTTCRHLGRAAGGLEQSPRQREFLRRRNLASDAERTPHSPCPSIPHSPFCRDADSGALSFQHPRNCPTFPPALPSLSISLSTLAEAIPRPGASMNTQGSTDPELEGGAGLFLLAVGVPTNLLSPSPQEALHRELLLKQKMVILQELFSTLLQASEKSWQGQLNEDKLKCKLRALESQLQACTQSYTKECVKKILIEMEDQKQTYEQKAKEALQKMLEDKLQTEQELQNSQRNLAVTREDLAFWKDHYTTLKAELTKTSAAHTELENSFHVLQSELQRAEAQREQLRGALQSLREQHTELCRQSSALREDNHLQAQHISAIQDKLQKEQNQRVTLEATISHLQSLIQSQAEEWKVQEVSVQRKDQVFTMQTSHLTPSKEKQNTLLEHPEEEEGE
ncbi:T3JAM protein, partial [Hemiprocne comata]|nr:T3JAM protein [Hemiprocne comata]